jgi:putative hydrolase of HD superfamily
MNITKICNYIFELGVLKKFQHSGTKMAGVKDPDTIAEHAYRTAIIGYILATMEKANPEKTALMCLLHDNAEARITDLHKVARRYIDSKDAEMQAYTDQTENLPYEIGKTFLDLFQEYEHPKNKEAVIARDADMLETAFQAKEYLDMGYKACQDWISNVEKSVKTKSAKTLLKTMKKTDFTAWWRGLKKIDIGY